MTTHMTTCSIRLAIVHLRHPIKGVAISASIPCHARRPTAHGYLLQITQEIQAAHDAPTYTQLLMLTHLFCWWGKLHPFLDGNGHIQRILFAAAAIELGIPLSQRFAIHPRSFDRLLAWPLEMFTRSDEIQREQFIAMIAEYLSTWLGGPFDKPGSGIPDE